HTLKRSAQPELNRRVLHGEQVGYRYIMGALQTNRIVKEPEHRAGVEPALPHYGCGVVAAGPPVLVVSVGPEGLEPSPTWLRARYAAASTSIPSLSSRFSSSLADQSARKESNPRPGPYKSP